MATPSGAIYLLEDIYLDSTYEHTIRFKNKDEQLEYFSSKIKKEYKYTTYIRKKDVLRVEYSLDEIEGINYLMFRAKENSKWYYAFIVEKKYKSDNVTELVTEIDVMQTYHFDYQLLPSFVERSHVDRWAANFNNQSPIFSYTEEDVDLGKEYITEKAYTITPDNNVMWFMVLMTHSQEFHEGLATPSALNDLPTPYMTYLVPHYVGDNSKTFLLANPSFTTSIASMSDLMMFMGDSALGAAIKEISYIPYLPFNIECVLGSPDTSVVICNILESGLTMNVDILKPKESWIANVVDFLNGDKDPTIKLARINGLSSKFKDTITLTSFNRFTGTDFLTGDDLLSFFTSGSLKPNDYRLESKLYTYPFRYNLLTNWKQPPVTIKNEYLNDEVKIKMSKALSFNNPARYWIEGYKGDVNGRNDSLVETSTIDLPIISDAYYQYQLQNRSQINTQLVTGVVNSAVGVATAGKGNIAAAATGATLDTGSAIAGEIAKTSDLKNMPDSIINSMDGSLSIADKNIYLSFYRYKIQDSYLERIGQYFHMFGYKVNKVMDLEEAIKSRARFNYIKTISANITGGIDHEDLLKIKNNFNKGITFWHYRTPLNFLDYSLCNMEMSFYRREE